MQARRTSWRYDTVLMVLAVLIALSIPLGLWMMFRLVT